MKFTRQLLGITVLIVTLIASIVLIVYTSRLLPRKAVTRMIPERAVFVLEMTRNGIERIDVPDSAVPEVLTFINELKTLWSSIGSGMPVPLESASLVLTREDQGLEPSLILTSKTRLSNKERRKIESIQPIVISSIAVPLLAHVIDKRVIVLRPEGSTAYDTPLIPSPLQGNSGIGWYIEHGTSEQLADYLNTHELSLASTFSDTAGDMSFFMDSPSGVFRLRIQSGEQNQVHEQLVQLVVPPTYSIAMTGYDLTNVLAIQDIGFSETISALAEALAHEFHVPDAEIRKNLVYSKALMRSGDSWLMVMPLANGGPTEDMLASAFDSSVRKEILPDGSEYRVLARSKPTPVDVSLNGIPARSWRTTTTSLFSSDIGNYRYLSNDSALLQMQFQQGAGQFIGETQLVDACLGNEAAGSFIDLIALTSVPTGTEKEAKISLIQAIFSQNMKQTFVCIDG